MGYIFDNYYMLDITCADPGRLLDRLLNNGVLMRKIQMHDAFTFSIQISGKHIRTVNKVAKGFGAEVRISSMYGLSVFLRLLKRHFLLLGAFAILLFLTFYTPTRILFVSVEGNSRLDSAYILEQAEAVGITFGTARKDVRSEKMKNALLYAVPELKWAGINTYGCYAVISVTEREEPTVQNSDEGGVKGIYATRDGIISEITVTKGTAMCETGQAIHAGQLLVSGYTNCGLYVRAERAEGEVCAITQRKMLALLPAYTCNNKKIAGVDRKWNLQIGKKRIKLYIDSGNYTTGCGKIYETYHLTLPGGFRLPISVVKETTITYADSVGQIIPDDVSAQKLVADHIVGDMIAGRIMSLHVSSARGSDICALSCAAICEEMVGTLRNEELE